VDVILFKLRRVLATLCILGDSDSMIVESLLVTSARQSSSKTTSCSNSSGVSGALSIEQSPDRLAIQILNLLRSNQKAEVM
jgi:hypothetical protein